MTLTRALTGPVAGQRRRFERRPTATVHMTGLVLAVAGAVMAISAGVERLQGGSQTLRILISGAAVGITGLVLWSTTRVPDRIPTASMFATVLAVWISFALVATIPFLVTDTFARFDHAFFESVAGVTTTSATVLRPVEGAAPGILFWRSATQWIGGLGAVVFAVSVLPFLGVGVMELSAASRMRSAAESLAPRVRATAARLAPVYVGFTVVVAGAYAAAGMAAFDAVTHAFTTVSTGGFSTRTASFAAFDAPAQWVGIVAMVLAGGSYPLYWRALRGKPLVVVRSAEFLAYLAITAAVCAGAAGWNAATYGSGVRRTIFATVSITSTTGYRLVDYNRWPVSIQLVLVFAMGLGAMAGSAAGGFKIGRLLAVLSYARRQVFSQLHPRAVSVVRFGREVVPEAVLGRIVGFFALFMAIGGLATLLVAAFGADMRTAISSVASAIGNVGPGLGAVGPLHDHLDISAGARWVLMVVMLTGRLEVFPVLLGAIPLVRFVADRLPGRARLVLLRLGRG